MKQFLLYFLIGFYLISCNSEETAETKAETPDHSKVDWKEVELDSSVREHIPVPEMETFTLNKKIENNGDILAEFDIQSVHPKSDTLGLKVINMEVNEWVRSNFYVGEDDFKEKSLDSLIARYDRFLKNESEIIGFGAGWEINANASVNFNKNGLMNYDLTVYSYTGGAHGNATTILRTYDVITGARLSLVDMFEDTLMLQKKMNEVFQSTMPEEIKSNVSVDEIPLTSNVQLGKDTLIFYFNAYEIGPYSMGPVELKIATKDLKGNLKIKLD
ncbi:MAG: DUF4163 domain-containing protein [Crocinitomicaceae bacterium]